MKPAGSVIKFTKEELLQVPAQQVQGVVQLTDAQKLEILIQQLEACSSLHQKYERGFRANAPALTILQAIAGGTVAILSAIRASKENAPKQHCLEHLKCSV